MVDDSSRVGLSMMMPQQCNTPYLTHEAALFSLSFKLASPVLLAWYLVFALIPKLVGVRAGTLGGFILPPSTRCLLNTRYAFVDSGLVFSCRTWDIPAL
jgi:hypothetical protein